MGATWSWWVSGGTSHLLHAEVFPEHRAEAALVAHFQVRHVFALLTDERDAVGVGGHLIDRRDDGVHLTRVVDVAPLWAVPDEDARGIDDDERGAHERREVGHGNVDVLVQA